MNSTRHFIRFAVAVLMAWSALPAQAQSQYAFRVTFTDKKGSSGDLSKPGDFLSARALRRRSTQKIAIDSADLPISAAYLDSTLRISGGILHSRSRWLNNCVILLPDTSLISPLRGKAFIQDVHYVAAFAAPLHLLRSADEGTTTFPSSPEGPLSSNRGQWFKTSSAAYYGDAYDQIALANGDYLHNLGYRGRGQMIAVIDAGFLRTDILGGFDSLRLSGRIADTYNFNLDTSYIYAYSTHGTQVLSTMAGILSKRFVGTAPDAQYALYVSENELSEQPYEMDNLVAAMERADSIGCDVINISLGYNTFSIGGINADLNFSELDGKTTVVARAANKATEKGVLVVSTAGNDGSGSWKKILTPGDADSALTVGSVTPAKVHVASSGTGPNAAGVRKPDVSMLGAPAVILGNAGTPVSGNGTSFATPELAGLAACLWQAVPLATPFQLREAIRNSGHVAASPDNALGFGVPDFAKALAALKINDTITAPVFRIYPNPFSDHIYLSLTQALTTHADWQLTDISGRVISQGRLLPSGTSQNRIDLPLLPAGIYCFSAYSAGWQLRIKLSKAP